MKTVVRRMASIMLLGKLAKLSDITFTFNETNEAASLEVVPRKPLAPESAYRGINLLLTEELASL